MRILLIDDEEVVLNPISRLLKSLDYEVDCAGDAQQALALLGQRDVDLVVSDIRMPGMDGLDLAHLIMERHPHMPVVLMAGYIDDEILQRSRVEGIHRLLSKPIEIGKLIDIISELQQASDSDPR